MNDIAPETTSRRKRRRKKAQDLGWQSPTLGRNLAIAVFMMAGAAYASAALGMWNAAAMAGVLAPGMTEAEVRYLRGEPRVHSPDDRTWTYSEGEGAESLVRFDDSRHIESITCRALSGSAFGCPEAFGVTIGTTEDRVINRLGVPSDQTYIPNGKIMTFGDLGLVYTMREYRVVQITKLRRRGVVSLLGRTVWNLLP